MMKTLIPALTAAFVAVAPARADTVRVVTGMDAFEPGTVAIEVYRGQEKVWNTAMRCETVRTMGITRLQNLVRAYAQDAFVEINGQWEAAQFEKQLNRSVGEPIYNIATTCTLK